MLIADLKSIIQAKSNQQDIMLHGYYSIAKSILRVLRQGKEKSG